MTVLIPGFNDTRNILILMEEHSAGTGIVITKGSFQEENCRQL
ncbi:MULTISPECIES: hypothetical protein [unclassified Methanoregula]|nr:MULTISPECIES: hypothetical protein [unclassified Methanoregula]